MIKTTIQPHWSQSDLLQKAVAKVNRDEQGGPLLGKAAFRGQCKLLRVLLDEVGGHYLTLPCSVAHSIKEFLDA